MSTPLTDRINALTALANEKTGAEDATLTDAVGRLIDGYIESVDVTIDDGSMTLSPQLARYLFDAVNGERMHPYAVTLKSATVKNQGWQVIAMYFVMNAAGEPDGRMLRYNGGSIYANYPVTNTYSVKANIGDVYTVIPLRHSV